MKKWTKISLTFLYSIFGIFFIASSVFGALTFYKYDFWSVAPADHGIFEYGCIPRPSLDPNGGDWFILDNEGHQPEGCVSIETYNDHLQVDLDNCLDKVITAHVTVDEGLASLGIHPGLRMGFCEWSIYLFDNNNNIIDPSTLSSSNAQYGGFPNLWISVRGTD